MKSVKCHQCGFVGWAGAERCKKCGFSQTLEPDQTSVSYRPTSGVRYQAGDPQYPSGKLKQGLAVSSLVLGIAGFLTLGLLGVGALAGIALAIVALSKAKQSPHEYGGQGVAIAGLVTNIVSLVAMVPIAIIAAIAIPNLLAARSAANEASTIRALRTIHLAQISYQETRGAGQFGKLDQLAVEGLITKELASGSHHGYKFTVDVQTVGFEREPHYRAVGVPLTYGSTGRRSFYVDETGILRAGDNRGREATESNAPLNDYGYSSSSPPSRRYPVRNY